MDAVKFLADLATLEQGNRLRLGVAQVRSVDTDPEYTLVTGQAVVVPAAQGVQILVQAVVLVERVFCIR